MTRRFAGGAIRPDCRMMTAWPAIVSDMLRAVLAELGIAVSVTVPDPGPPPLMVNQVPAPAVDHVQPDCVATVTVADPPGAPMARLPGETE